MRVSEVNARFPRQGQTASDVARAPGSESRALVPLTPAAMADPANVYRQAPFLAQLIATKAHVPQTRERRRAEPEEALAAYRAGASLLRE